MKKFKKLMITLIAVCMVFTMSVPAVFADGDGPYTITINGVKSGHTYGAYQLFQGTLDSEGKILTNIEWGSGIDGAAFLAYLKDTTANGGKFKEDESANVFAACANAADVANVLSTYANNDSMLDKFAKEANKYLKDVKLTSTPTTEDPVVYKITGAAPGYYLIKDVDAAASADKADFNTKIILSIVGNAEVTVKGKIPDVEKTVNDTIDGTYKESVDVHIGTAVYFKIEGTLPSNYEMYDTYYYEFVDTMPTSLAFANDLTAGSTDLPSVYISRVVDGVDTHVSIPAGQYTMAYDNVERTFKVTFNNLKADGMPTLLMEDKIVVKYKATLTSDAIIGNGGNVNKAYIEYSNDPYTAGHGKTENDEAKVYTFGMDLAKVDAEHNTTMLPGAQFVLYARNIKEIDGVEKFVYRYVTFGAADSGVRKVSGWLESDPEPQSVSPAVAWEHAKAKFSTDPENVNKVVLTTDENGKINVAGLDAHVYHLQEVVAPETYNLPKDPFVVSIQPTYDNNGFITKLMYELDSVDVYEETFKDTGYIKVTIQNGKGHTLPSTGGIGTTIFYLLGGILVLAALILLITKRRMRGNEQ